MFGPLTFPHQNQKSNTLLKFDDDLDELSCCLLCDEKFCLTTQHEEMLLHLFNRHHLVIGDVNLIASMKSYLAYWRIRLASNPLTDFCSTVLMDTKPDGTSSKDEKFYLLADILPEDRLLREGLQQKRLEWVLDKQAEERDDRSFSRGCLFCRQEFAGSRAEYINHLSQQHNLQLGRPENLVFTDELLDTIKHKLDSLLCLFCEKLFRDRTVLKEHMRKKIHKRINPDNKLYDKFYVVNYLEMGKDWQQVQKEPDEFEISRRGNASGSEDNSDWSDWQDEESPSSAVVCLFCEKTGQHFNDITRHMADQHGFPFSENCDEEKLDFYQKVKLVNYIRGQVHRLCCMVCDKEHSSRQSLLVHMETSQHFTMPPSKLWDQPEYYFPTYEDDSFLCFLDNMADTDTAESTEKSGQI
nr:unnamed protein product [Timema shepardi]